MSHTFVQGFPKCHRDGISNRSASRYSFTKTFQGHDAAVNQLSSIA